MAGSLSWKETDHHHVETDLRRALVRNRLMESGGVIQVVTAAGGTTNVAVTAVVTAAAVVDPLTRSDSMDSMLGDSLLDPPQSLQKIPPKRYQSPSRCGSPSLEAPDHLLFGSSDRSNLHYNSMERKNKSNPFKVGGGGGDHHQENMMSRFARQDLLRRRDLNSVM